LGHTACGTITDVRGEAEELAKAADAYRRAQDELAAARSSLAEKIIDAARAGMPQREIVRLSGYTREHVRRISRAAGLEPETD
jgi:predicted transcriptional regulator